jgi:hypothetical protein
MGTPRSHATLRARYGRTPSPMPSDCPKLAAAAADRDNDRYCTGAGKNRSPCGPVREWCVETKLSTRGPESRSISATNRPSLASWKALPTSSTSGVRYSSIIVFSTSLYTWPSTQATRSPRASASSRARAPCNPTFPAPSAAESSGDVEDSKEPTSRSAKQASAD